MQLTGIPATAAFLLRIRDDAFHTQEQLYIPEITAIKVGNQENKHHQRTDTKVKLPQQLPLLRRINGEVTELHIVRSRLGLELEVCLACHAGPKVCNRRSMQVPLGRCFLAHYKDLHSVGDNVLMSGISSGEHTDWASESRFPRWRQNILISNSDSGPGLSFLIACQSHRGDNLNLIECDVFPSSFTLKIPTSLTVI